MCSWSEKNQQKLLQAVFFPEKDIYFATPPPRWHTHTHVLAICSCSLIFTFLFHRQKRKVGARRHSNHDEAAKQRSKIFRIRRPAELWKIRSLDDELERQSQWKRRQQKLAWGRERLVDLFIFSFGQWPQKPLNLSLPAAEANNRSSREKGNNALNRAGSGRIGGGGSNRHERGGNMASEAAGGHVRRPGSGNNSRSSSTYDRSKLPPLIPGGPPSRGRGRNFSGRLLSFVPKFGWYLQISFSICRRQQRHLQLPLGGTSSVRRGCSRTNFCHSARRRHDLFLR